MNWPDGELADAVCDGAEIVEDIPKFHIFRECEGEAELSIEELDETNEAWIDELMQHSRPKAEEVDVVWRKSEEERERGLIRGWFGAHLRLILSSSDAVLRLI